MKGWIYFNNSVIIPKILKPSALYNLFPLDTPFSPINFIHAVRIFFWEGKFDPEFPPK